MKKRFVMFALLIMGILFFVSCERGGGSGDDNIGDVNKDTVGIEEPAEPIEPEEPSEPEEPTEPEEPKNLEAGHEYVDLGLSVKWATCNVGAVEPEHSGVFYAWGETLTKSEYTWDNYKHYKNSAMTKYTESDNKIILDPEDDVAHSSWGGSWRMPTKEEQEELHRSCTWEWTEEQGVVGYLVTSKVEGYTENSIFLPAAGCKKESTHYGEGEYGYYLSSSCMWYGSNQAWVIHFGSHYIASLDVDRAYGYSVRAVCE